MEQFVRDYFKARREGYKPYRAARIAASYEAWEMNQRRLGYRYL